MHGRLQARVQEWEAEAAQLREQLHRSSSAGAVDADAVVRLRALRRLGDWLRPVPGMPAAQRLTANRRNQVG